jgi:hypothetical protein
MLGNRRIIFVTTVLSVILLGVTTAYRAYLIDAATSDEFAVYAAFLVRLSHDSRPTTTFALADFSSKLTTPTPETWVPEELHPFPPEKAVPPDQFVNFCGRWCGHEFMRRNLRRRRLNPNSSVHFPFDVISESTEVTARKQGKRVVNVTRPGFDFWHHRAVLTYGFDCSSDGTEDEDQIPSMCVQTGEVVLEQVNEKWVVRSYSAHLL